MKLNISQCTAAPANRIYLIDALGGAGLQTARSKHEKLVDEILALMPEQSQFISKKVSLLKCSTLEEVNEIFKLIEDDCNAETSPLIFIDGHGDKEQGLALPSGEYLGWNVLNLALESITLAAAGHSTVVASFCHSMTAVERPPYEKPLPTPFYFGYTDEVLAGVVEEECQKIIEELLRSGTFIESGKTIQLYSEYTHVFQLISVLLMKFLRPQEVAEKFPGLSKNHLRKTLYEEIGRSFGSTKGLNKILSQAFNPQILMGPILATAMHATERRTRLLDELLVEIELDMNHPDS